MEIAKFIKKAFVGIIILLIVYIIINLLHLVYSITDPNGLAGIQLFLETFIVFVVLFFLLLYFFWIVIKILIAIFLRKSPLMIIKLDGKLFTGVVFVLFLFIVQYGYILISRKLADRYRLLKVSEQLISEGKYKLALNKAHQAYARYNKLPNVNSFFIFSKLYYTTTYGEKLSLTKQYSSIINYAYCLVQNNLDLALAERLFLYAAKLSEGKLLKKEEGNKVFPYSSLASLYLNIGDYSKANYYRNELLDIVSKVSGTDIEYIIMFQETYASYSLTVGDIEKAKENRENNIKLWEENNPSSKGIIYLNLLLLGITSEISDNNYQKAGEYLIKAQPIALKMKKKAEYLTYLTLKGIYCDHFANYANGNTELIKKMWFNRFMSFFDEKVEDSVRFKFEAEVCFKEYLKIEKAKNGKQSIGYIKGLQRLVNFYNHNGYHAKTDSIVYDLKHAIESFKDTNKKLYYDVLLTIISFEFSKTSFNEIIGNIQELEDYHFNKLTSNYSFYTERERESYKNIIDIVAEEINKIYVLSKNQDALGRIYDNLLSTKQIALYANESIRNNLSIASYSLRNEYYTLLKQRDSLERIKKVEEYTKILKKEKKIQEKLKFLKGYRSFNPRNVQWKEVQEALESNEVAIEFFELRQGSSVQYYAILLSKNKEAPQLIPLFEESLLQKLLDQPGSLKERIDLVYGKRYKDLYSLVWAPLDKELQGVKRVFISVSGLLHGVSFPALIKDNKYDVILLGSTRQVINRSVSKPFNSVALVGDVEYGIVGDKSKKSTRGYFKNLPYTVYEIEKIKSIINKFNPNIKTQLLTKNTATEREFYNLENYKPNIIHLATHGYFYHTKSSYLVENSLIQYNNNPMLRSGIVLAGVNSTTNRIGSNDGFLSAQEIARRDLSYIDLAVLSACETGLGEEIGSEGIFGLQRALKLAGTRSIIMSLWKVPDRETSELMVYFYENYFTKGMNKYKALKEAQYQMRSNEKTSSPYYWGGFVLLEQ